MKCAALLFLNMLSKKREVITLCAQPGREGGEREGRGRGVDVGEREERGKGKGGGKSTIPSALVEGGKHVSDCGLWREDVMLMVTVGTCIFVKLLVFLWHLFQSFLVLDPPV